MHLLFQYFSVCVCVTNFLRINTAILNLGFAKEKRILLNNSPPLKIKKVKGKINTKLLFILNFNTVKENPNLNKKNHILMKTIIIIIKKTINFSNYSSTCISSYKPLVHEESIL